MFVDSHCHLDFPELFQRLEQIRSTMANNQVSHALCISVNLPDYPNVLKLAHSYDNFYASVGVHPDYEDTPEPTVELLVGHAQDSKVVAIGETGLDYFRLKGDLEWQRERFRTHIRASIACSKPLIVHTRSASEDTIRILQEEGVGADNAGVMHCFTENWAVAQAALDLGFYISFSGIVTFKSAKELQEVALKVPLDRMLIETDSPYLAPTPFRGKQNEPGFVRHVAEYIATLRGESLEKIGAQTSANFFKLFNINQ